MNVGHPLFPVAEDEDPPEISYIHVTRYDSPGSKPIWAPRRFEPHELQSLGDVYQHFGGGAYELIARNDRHITARVSYQIPGQPRPLVDEGPPAGAESAPAPQGNDPNVQLIGLLMSMMQSSQKESREFMAMMMQNQQQQSQQFVQLMQSTLQSQGQGQAKLYESLLQAGKGNSVGSELEQVMKAIRMGVELKEGAGGGEEDWDVDALVEKGLEIAKTLQGFGVGGQGKSIPAPGQAANGPAQAAPPANGPAATPPNEPPGGTGADV